MSKIEVELFQCSRIIFVWISKLFYVITYLLLSFSPVEYTHEAADGILSLQLLGPPVYSVTNSYW